MTDAYLYFLAVFLLGLAFGLGWRLGYVRGVDRGHAKPIRHRPLVTANDEWPDYKPWERRR